ncbi:MAG: Hpt domain-containing protein, partial [Sterolibacterium sp.]
KLDQWLPLVESTSSVDRSVLAEITGGDATIEQEILMDFRRINDDDAAMLQDAVNKHDTQRVTLASHRIKGASNTVGATALAAVSARLEHAARAGDWTVIAAEMKEFQHELERLNTHCEAVACTLPN